jgi:hypothetical protein
VTPPPNSLHLNFDDAWNPDTLSLRTLDFRDWGPKLRYFAGPAALDHFDRDLPRSLPPFLLYGSGDFHHLSALWLRRAVAPLEHGGQVTLVSFDNHPDWDIRPPRFSCGAWINRALELAAVRQVQIWGCGNFELAFPHNLFANRSALRDGRLLVHPWRERFNAKTLQRFEGMSRDGWKYRFEQFAAGLKNANVYVTVDIDCLTCAQASTNWENGLFTAAEVAWAIGELRSRATLIGGDLCGAFSPPRCHGLFRKFATWWDHPRTAKVNPSEARQINLSALRAIWPALADEPASSP